MATPHEADLMNEDRRKQAEMMIQHLENIGVQGVPTYFPLNFPAKPAWVIDFPLQRSAPRPSLVLG